MADTSVIEKFLHATETATIPSCQVRTADATRDATVPNWRLHPAGADAIRSQDPRWFADPGQAGEPHRYSVEGGGEIVEQPVVVVDWDGASNYART